MMTKESNNDLGRIRIVMKPFTLYFFHKNMAWKCMEINGPRENTIPHGKAQSYAKLKMETIINYNNLPA